MSLERSERWLPKPPSTDDQILGVGACRLVSFERISGDAGELLFGESPSHLPFRPQRFFLIQNVPSTAQRGAHAHKRCHQVLICVSGAVSALINDGDVSKVIRLDDPSMGLYMPPMIWGTQFDYSPDARLVVLASDRYDKNDYISSHEEFLLALGRR